MASYGKSAWGTAAYGDAPVPPGVFRFSSAVAMDTHRIRVTLTRAAKAVSSYGAGDALNPATWTVTRLDTSAVLTVLTVTKISGTVYDLITLETLGAYSVSHKVSSDTLLADDGTLIGELQVNFGTWTTQPSVSGLSAFMEVARGASLFVASGIQSVADTYVITSPDGVNWTLRLALTGPSGGAINGGVIGWNGSHFVSLCAASCGPIRCMVSPDGINWTASQSGQYPASSGATRSKAVWNGVRWTVVGDETGAGTGVMTSTDGVVWSLGSMPSIVSWHALAWNGSIYVALGVTGVLATSPDGLVWTPRTSLGVSIDAVAWSDKLGLFAAVGQDFCATSPDGINWTQRPIPSGAKGYAQIEWNGSYFLALGGGAGNVGSAYSFDGLTWLAAPAPIAAGSFARVGSNMLAWSETDKIWVYTTGRTVAQADRLQTLSGETVRIFNSLTFPGMTASVVSGAPGLPGVERAPSVGVDLRNLPAPSAVTIAGTLVMTDGGDYAVESGAPLLRKLLLRRLFTDRGGFFHLPAYGLGLREKRTVGISFLPKLKREIEAQVKREPEVEDASASLSLSSGVLTVRIRAKMRASSVPVEVTASVPVAL